MKPAAFKYFAPDTVEEVIELLARFGDEAKIIAGGQSLVPIMNFRLGRPEILIDINRINELEYVKEENGSLFIGALTRERDIETSPIAHKGWPILPNAISYIGHVAIRNRGTIGGSLVHADPSAEIPTVIRALDGVMKAQGPSGERIIEPEEFFLTYLTTSLDPDEILLEIKIPALPDNSGWSFVELTRRCGDFAIVTVACILTVDENGVCKEARISVGGIEPTPIRAEEAESLLSGQFLVDELIEAAGKAASESVEPESDYHASAEYRRDMTRLYIKKAIKEAHYRCKGGK